ncbi:MAG: trehalose-phosphatase, partial [Acetobacteraceae bacterium]
GALALLSGRPLEALDGFLAPLRLPAAAEHGLVLRRSGRSTPEPVAAPAVPPAWREAAQALAAATPGALCEQKSHGFTLHARAVPEALPRLGEALRELLAGHPDFRLLPAHMAWEVKPRAADKGTALVALMQCPPFAGRRPVFVGDDVTDEDAIAAARALGGEGYRVEESFGDPAGVRAWLGGLALEAAHG